MKFMAGNKTLYGLGAVALIATSTVGGTFTLPGIGTAVGYTTAMGVAILGYLILF